jgi:tRNA(fMet)-specific endonuclease VapC
VSEYLLDSDWAIDVLNGQTGAIDLLLRLEPSGIALSIISYGELYQGAYYGRNPEEQLASLAIFFQGKEVIAPNIQVMERFGILRGLLPQNLRRQIGDMDFLIAATAMVYDMTLVTRNIRDFQHIPGLRIYRIETAD